MKPAPPVTSTSIIVVLWRSADQSVARARRACPTRAAECAEDVRERPDARQRDGEVEAVVFGHRARGDAAEIVLLVLEREATALRVVAGRKALLEEAAPLDVVVEVVHPDD